MSVQGEINKILSTGAGIAVGAKKLVQETKTATATTGMNKLLEQERAEKLAALEKNKELNTLLSEQKEKQAAMMKGYEYYRDLATANMRTRAQTIKDQEGNLRTYMTGGPSPFDKYNISIRGGKFKEEKIENYEEDKVSGKEEEDKDE